MKERFLYAVSAMVGVLALLAACASGSTALPTKNEALATAILSFGSSFGSNVIDASVVVVPRSGDLDEINAVLDGGPVAVHSSDEAGATWRVLRVVQIEDHWEIDIETSDGSRLFAATVLIGADKSGLPVVLSPDVVGVTPTSVVS